MLIKQMIHKYEERCTTEFDIEPPHVISNNVAF